MSFAQGAPTQPLVLQGSNVFLYGSSTAGNAFTVQQLSAGNVASFQTSTNATALIINPAGNVGIGTTNPGDLLHVYASLGSQIRVDGGSGGSGDPCLAFYNGATFRGRVAYSTVGTYMYFQNDSQDKMRFYNGAGGAISLQPTAGNVGIGMTSPATALDINTTTGINLYSTSTTTPLFKMVTFGNHQSSTFWSEDWDGTAGGPGSSLFTMDHSTGQGLFNLLAGGYNDANTFRYGSTRGACRIAMGDAAFGVSLSSLTAGTKGSAMTLYNSITSDVNTIVLYTNAGTERVRVDSAGNVGIGTASPGFRHHVYNGDSSFSYYGPNATWGAYLLIGAGNNNRTSGRAQIISTNGNLHMDSGTGQIMYLNYYANGDGVGAECRQYGALNVTGDITAFYSDERLKTKVGRIENALDKVCSLTAFKYVHNDIAKSVGFESGGIQVGLSAQEVQKVLPEVVARAPFDEGTVYDVGVGKSKSGQDYLTLKYERLVPLLVEALKEERAERLKVDESLRTTNERLARLEKLLLKE